jgi:hypothetical protein
MRTFVHRWIAATVIVSIIAAVDNGWVMKWLALAPDRVLHGEIWRLVSWTLIARTPVALVVIGWLLYKFGGELAAQWGEPRLRSVAVQIAVVSGLATCAVALLIGKHDPHTCSSLTMVPLVILWGRQYPDRDVVLYGMIPLKAAGLVRYLSGFVGLCAVYYGIYAFAPELVGCAIALVYPKGWLRR